MTKSLLSYICTVVISLYRADVFMTKEKGKEGAIEDYFGKVWS